MPQSSEAIYNNLANQKIAKLFWQYALPAIIGAVVSTLYNIIDGIFIGHWVGKEALGGLGVILPIMSLASAMGMLVGVGSASRLSIALGQKDYALAEKIVGTSFLLTLLLSGSTVALIFSQLEKILYIVGASPVTYPYARDFLQIFLPGSLALTLCFNFNNMMRATGFPTKAMITMFISVIANIILAPLFILYLGWGIRGAATATVISMLISFVFVMQHFTSRKYDIRLRLKNIRLRWPLIKSIVAIGLAPFFIQIAASLVVILINHQINFYAPLAGASSDNAIAAFANANRLLMLVVMIVVGLTQGMQPIVGFNYGAKHFLRVKQTLFFTIKMATIVTTIGFICGFLLPKHIVKVFSHDPDIVKISAQALHDITLSYPIIGFQIVVTSFFQCLGMAKQAIFLSLTRQVIFLIPALIIMPYLFGLSGVWWASPIADVLASALTMVLLYYQLKRMKRYFDADPQNPVNNAA